MRRESLLAGLGALAFGILTFVAFIVANPPGGNYKASDVSKFLAKGHRFEVFLSIYLMLIAAAGLRSTISRVASRSRSSDATPRQ